MGVVPRRLNIDGLLVAAEAAAPPNTEEAADVDAGAPNGVVEEAPPKTELGFDPEENPPKAAAGLGVGWAPERPTVCI